MICSEKGRKHRGMLVSSGREGRREQGCGVSVGGAYIVAKVLTAGSLHLCGYSTLELGVVGIRSTVEQDPSLLRPVHAATRGRELAVAERPWPMADGILPYARISSEIVMDG